MNNTLLENFYTEISSTYSAQNKFDFNCVIRFNPRHPIYKGHFEQIPIAPGVCLIQVIKELLMDKFQKEMILMSANNIKFLAMINPSQITDFSVLFSIKIDGDIMDVTATYTNNNTPYMKFKGKFRIGK